MKVFMANFMRYFLVLLIAVCISASAQAKDYHFCSTGNDSNDGSSDRPWLTWSKVMHTFEAAVGGDNILFCRDGIIDVTGSKQMFNKKASDDNRVSFDAYGSGELPILSPTDGSIPLFINSRKTGASNDGGFNIKNLNFKCATRGCSGRAIWLFNGISYTTIDNVIIDGFVSGMATAVGNTDQAYNISLLNSTIKNNTNNGFFGGSDNLIIDNTTFENNGYNKPNLGHNLYLGSSGTDGNENIRITNNRFLKNTIKYQNVINLGTDDFVGTPAIGNSVVGNSSGATGVIARLDTGEMYIHMDDADLAIPFAVGERITVDGSSVSMSTIGTTTTHDACSSVNMVGHGHIDGMVVRGNYFYEEQDKATPQCFGIGIGPGYSGEETFENLIIQDNELFGAGTTSIMCASCQHVEISNNRIRQSVRYAKGIMVNTESDDAGMASDYIDIINNVVIIEKDPRVDVPKVGIMLEVVNGSIDGNVIFITNENARSDCLRYSKTIDVEADNHCRIVADPLGSIGKYETSQ